MVNRTIVGPFEGSYVLRISRPGYDVMNTGLSREFLAFDSRWTEAGNLYMAGSIQINGGNDPPLYATGSMVDVPYGRVFAKPPLVVAVMLLGDGRYTIVPTVKNGLMQVWIEPYLDKVTFCKWTPDADLAGWTTIYYKIYRNVYG